MNKKIQETLHDIADSLYLPARELKDPDIDPEALKFYSVGLSALAARLILIAKEMEEERESHI